MNIKQRLTERAYTLTRQAELDAKRVGDTLVDGGDASKAAADLRKTVILLTQMFLKLEALETA